MRNSASEFLSFTSYCMRHSFAQNFQDLWAVWETGFKHRDAYFVEFGALNGRDFSNSYLLEKLGWSGAIAEPHPDYADIIQANRRCAISTKCVFARTGETVIFNTVKGRPALSSIASFTSHDDKQHLRERFTAHEIETISLIDLLKDSNAPKRIDFLSIDTEGSELEILSAFDFEMYDVQLICVEHNDHLRDELYALLTSHGYVRKWPELSGHDDWYTRADSYPRWSARGLEKMKRKISKLPRFDNQISEREAKLRTLIDKT